ncbi:MAG: uracil-DNA glycosylase [Actinomycetes bacterium]
MIALADLSAVAAAARRCTTCADLAATRTSVVVGDLPAEATLLLIGEAPGADEDRTGRPFVGRAGQLLDVLLREAGVARDSVAVANVLKCRPPGNRAPTRTEVHNCRGWLERQVQLLAPRVVVTLGATAAAWAFGRSVRLADVRGRPHDLPVVASGVVVPTYHPSAALRFGPRGEPRRLLGLDLAYAASLAAKTAL